MVCVIVSVRVCHCECVCVGVGGDYPVLRLFKWKLRFVLNKYKIVA